MLLQGPGIPWLPGTASRIDSTRHAESQARELLAKHPLMLGGVSAAALELDPSSTGSPDGANELVRRTAVNRDRGFLGRAVEARPEAGQREERAARIVYEFVDSQ